MCSLESLGCEAPEDEAERGQPGDVKSPELHAKDLDLKCRWGDIETKTK